MGPGELIRTAAATTNIGTAARVNAIAASVRSSSLFKNRFSPRKATFLHADEWHVVESVDTHFVEVHLEKIGHEAELNAAFAAAINDVQYLGMLRGRQSHDDLVKRTVLTAYDLFGFAQVAEPAQPQSKTSTDRHLPVGAAMRVIAIRHVSYQLVAKIALLNYVLHYALACHARTDYQHPTYVYAPPPNPDAQPAVQETVSHPEDGRRTEPHKDEEQPAGQGGAE